MVAKHPDLAYMQGDEILPVANFTGIGRLADREGVYFIGEEAYRSYKGYLFQTAKPLADQLLHIEFGEGQQPSISQVISVLQEPQAPSSIEEEWLQCNSSTLASAQIGNGKTRNKARRVKLFLYSKLFDYSSTHLEHAIRVRTEAQYKFWGLWLNGPTTTYIENISGSIRTYDDAVTVIDPSTNSIFNYPATLTNQDYSFPNYSNSNSSSTEEFLTIRFVRNLRLPGFHQPEVHWNWRRIRVRTTGTNGQYAHLNCD